jgi:hypothetical protein
VVELAALVEGTLAQVAVGEDGVAPALVAGASAQARGRAAPLVHLPGLTLVLLVAVLVAGALAQVVVGEDGEAPVLMVGASALARGRAAPLVHPLRLDTMAESLVHVLVGEDREALDALMAAASAQARA